MPPLSTPQAPLKRRRFSSAYKAKIVALCQQPDVSVARIALDHQLNANLVRRWIRRASAPVARLPPFVPVALPAPAKTSTAGSPSDTIRIEIPRAGGPVVVKWPADQAHQCIMLLRELLQ